jgi:hypothetical protein
MRTLQAIPGGSDLELESLGFVTTNIEF